ncbi:MAG TPA: diguanylate cyclase [Bryobacteraceae bacterium]|jgi:two-component system cell cycle response regulator|nr:diguanylate cyclase [Bryobacteraceae bacterium]
MGNKTPILVAENNPVSQSVLHSMLSNWDYEAVVAADGFEALSILQAEHGPRMAIVDSKLPGLNAEEVFRRVRALSQINDAYLLLLTDGGAAEELASAMDAGADDYITRPFHSQEFRARLQVGRRIVKLQERLILAHEELYDLASRDSLTGLSNSSTIIQILKSEIARSRRAATSIAVIMADIDHFKQVNERFGHMTGDTVLIEAAHRMSSLLRQYDSMGRFGGEEFLIVVPGCELAGSLAVAERLREVVACQPYSVEGGLCTVTCSLGLAWSESCETADANRLLCDAGAALYDAKRNGCNRVETVSSQPSAIGFSSVGVK